MKNKLNPSLLSITLLLLLVGSPFFQAKSQLLRKLEQKAQQKLEQAINKEIDKIGSPSSKKEKTNSTENQPTATPSEEKVSTTPSSTPPTAEVTKSANQDTTALFKRYNQFDFVAGEKIIAFDNYAQDELGQPPVKWNYTGNAEIVQLAGASDKFVAISGEFSLFHLDYIKLLPINFTLEFDLAVDENYKGGGFKLFFLHRAKETYHASNSFNTSSSNHPNGRFELDLSPINGNKDAGRLYYAYNYGDNTVANSDYDFPYFTAKKNNKVRVSIWRQNQRLRMYLDEHKVLDIPRAFNTSIDYTDLLFQITPPSPVYIGGVTLAVGKPDLRKKLDESGSFSTTGILFDLNAALVKPQSYGTLKEIASLLAGMPDKKVKITGHTDSDGKAEHNLILSRQRAEAVKKVLVEHFEIKATQLEVDGKGATQPIVDNTTDEGKAQNRRVEFTVLP